MKKRKGYEIKWIDGLRVIMVSRVNSIPDLKSVLRANGVYQVMTQDKTVLWVDEITGVKIEKAASCYRVDETVVCEIRRR